MIHEITDEFLSKRMTKYDKWLSEGKIQFSAKVVPVGESLSAHKWILPSEKVLEMLRNAGSFAVSRCVCRTHYGRCDAPREVCFFVNDFADKLVERGKARKVALDEAAGLLKKADKHGLVHLTLYRPNQSCYAICSCCECCCHDLQLLLKYGRAELVVRSDYIAETES
ncbi:hypothetical protein ACFL2Q_13550 [Thermodesulfobacteriota bacterium]